MVKTKLRPILPSLREKKRYLVFEAISESKITDSNAVASAIHDCALRFLGHLGAAKAGIMVLGNKWDEHLQRGMIKVNHKHVDSLKASLVFINRIGSNDVIFRSLGVSGILRKAESNYLKKAG